ncbi:MULTISPECIES: hypothetical protein [unclassified Crossiella]|uniref:hypothetical protein n=1 Tax=unclassified Crossiella TaxID=2620835 RepID=UPI001FFE5C98|nr:MULTISPECIES: hypothetical protein [unclassified Crossiella]MCK2240912.1 hypothetical protein [Crossiella sp. S99.2]MCK2253944.1 hypothetical protein [Crossiella sp. S99.1]
MSTLHSNRTRRIAEIVDSLLLPVPFTLRGFLDNLEARLQRRIVVQAAELDGSILPCGLLVCTRTMHLIVHAAGTTALHARHIIFHEIGHLLLGHGRTSGGDGWDNAAGLTPTPLSHQPVVRQLLPNVSPILLTRILGRTIHPASGPSESGFDTIAEAEAEYFAYSLSSRIAPAPGPAAPRACPDTMTGLLGALHPAPTHELR